MQDFSSMGDKEDDGDQVAEAGEGEVAGEGSG